MIWRGTIIGEPASKANSRKLVMFGKRPAFIKSDKARSYVKAAELQIKTISPLMTGPLRFTAHIYYASRRPDLDESVILDVLQGKVYLNDRQILEKHVYHGLDKLRPRAEIEVESL